MQRNPHPYFTLTLLTNPITHTIIYSITHLITHSYHTLSLTIIGAKQRAKLAKQQQLLEAAGGDGDEDEDGDGEEEDEVIEASEDDRREGRGGGGAIAIATIEVNRESLTKSRTEGIPIVTADVLRRKRR